MLHSECLQIFAASCQEPLPLAAHSESLLMCISHLFSEPTQWSLDFLDPADSACRSDSKPPISPITVAGAVTYLATASIIMRIRRLTLLKSLLFLHCIFPVRKSFFFCKRWVCIRWSWHSALTKCFQVSMATSCISSLVMMQPLKSFKPCCLKWSFCWILTPESLWNFLAGLDYLIRLQRLDLESWVVSLSFSVCQLMLWVAPNHFHFRVVLDSGCFFDYMHHPLCH